ncbi:MAG: hypothetical protein AVDCRST_MAG93-2822 [uncultured Chloroflexia bacterium]|uniref:Uncharacterized protein n=1 Tax=uncultured Chloroflexia bacterium TaxID=1672391 RepID=A0A6J4JDQ1_9CHLR|nr:MAG: hypothetical protein AVDCRST_MAG93-2822 [uncultured Chloroflexia bacterium]
MPETALVSESVATYLARGVITGEPGDGLLDVSVKVLNRSGYTRQATPVTDDDGITNVTVTIVETAPIRRSQRQRLELPKDA